MLFASFKMPFSYPRAFYVKAFTFRQVFERLMLSAGSVAFVSGAGAAIGSSVVKVPLAVCIRSVQAGAYPNAFAAAKSIVDTAGVRSLFTVSICLYAIYLLVLKRKASGFPKKVLLHVCSQPPRSAPSMRRTWSGEQR